MAWNPPKSSSKSTRYLEYEHRHPIAHDSFSPTNQYNSRDILSSDQAAKLSSEARLSTDSSFCQNSMPQSEQTITSSSNSHADQNKDSPLLAFSHERGNSDGSFFPSTTGSIYHPISRPRSRSDIPSHNNRPEVPQEQTSPWEARLLRGKNPFLFKDSPTGALMTPSPRRVIFPEHTIGNYMSSSNNCTSIGVSMDQKQLGHPYNDCDAFWDKSEEPDSAAGGVKLANYSDSTSWNQSNQNDPVSGAKSGAAGPFRGLVSEFPSLQIAGSKNDHKFLPEQNYTQFPKLSGNDYSHKLSGEYIHHGHGGKDNSLDNTGNQPQIPPDPSSAISAKRLQAKRLADLIRSGGVDFHPSTEKQVLHQAPAVGTSARELNSLQAPQNFVPNILPSQDPVVLHLILNGGITFEEMQMYNPFVERWRNSRPKIYGVVRISDIPYSTTQQEVVAIIGERAPIVKMPKNSGTYAIHIIMERSSAKSNDCFVEFETQQAAQSLVSRITSQGIHRRIRDRQVKFHMSSQEELMKELFPRANCVTWNGNDPVIEERKDWQTGFRGFVNSEEMVATIKWAQTPKRSRFSKGHPQRTYESVISLVEKYPWWSADKYTLKERDLIFRALHEQLKTLTEQLIRAHEMSPTVRAQAFPSTLDHRLLTELLHAGLEVPAFSEYQRSQLINATMGQVGVPVFVTRNAPYWPFETIGKRNEATEELVEYFASMFGKLSMTNPNSPTSSKSGNENRGNTSSLFGDFVVRWPENKQNLTIAEAATIEWRTIEFLWKQK